MSTQYGVFSQAKEAYMFSERFDRQYENTTEEALRMLVIERAKEADCYPALFETALTTYAKAWAVSCGYAKPEEDVPTGWDELDNAVQVDPQVSALRRDVNFIARHLCVTLPSVADDRAPAVKHDYEEYDDGFRW